MMLGLRRIITFSRRHTASMIRGRADDTPKPGFPTRFPDGHFYSPVLDVAEIERDRERIFQRNQKIVDVDLRESEQIALLDRLAPHATKIPFSANKTDNLRFYYENSLFSYSDAMVYASILIYYRPKRLIEIGSGFTSALALDVRDHFLPGLSCTFIDPHPNQMENLLTEGDRVSTRIIPSRVQDVPLSMFETLEANDILFIDSSHVAKAGSDVCFEIFQILPRLAPEVLVHFHDIFYPFEYLEEWLRGGISWNEAYLVRSLLGGGDRWQIAFFTDFMNRFYPKEMARKLPGSEKNTGGSLWITRTSN